MRETEPVREPEPVPERHHGHDLPSPLTSFVGRVAERAMVAGALTESRLVTLCGGGGCGKTRLAIAVAGDVRERFPDGVRFVDLSAVSRPELVVKAVAASYGGETDRPDQLDHLGRTVGDGRSLLVLDNCEHVVDAAAEVVDELLSRCPSLRVLATSREELRLGAELVRRVEPLALPHPAALGHDPAALLRAEAVQLFLDRARSALAGFAPTGRTLDAVARICERLDGVPLAVELAAALVSSLPVDEIEARLDDRFRLLDVAPRRVPSRQRTLRAALDWSFDLLDPPERDLFVRLGVFVGDFTLAAVEAVARADGDAAGPSDAVRSLRHLVSASMVVSVTSSGGADRYRLLETVRHYARARLDHDRPDVAHEAHRAHARYYAAFAAQAQRSFHGSDAASWLARVASELPNLRAAMAWAFGAGDLDTGLRLAGSLKWFFARMNLLDELDRWLDEGLRRLAELPPDVHLHALTAAAFVAFMRGEIARTRELSDEGVALARQLDDPRQLATALITRGGAAVYDGDVSRAEACFDESERLSDQLGDRWGQAWMATGRAVAARRQGDLRQARRQARDALAIFQSLADDHGQVLPLVNLALAAHEEGLLGEAHAAAREAAELATGLADRQMLHTALCVLGRIEQSLGHRPQARELLVRSIRDFAGARHHHMVAVALEGLAGLAGESGDHAATATLLAATARMRERSQIWLSDARRRQLETWLSGAREALDRDQLQAAQERGRQLTLDDLVTLAEAATTDLAGGGGATSDLATVVPAPPAPERPQLPQRAS